MPEKKDSGGPDKKKSGSRPRVPRKKSDRPSERKTSPPSTTSRPRSPQRPKSRPPRRSPGPRTPRQRRRAYHLIVNQLAGNTPENSLREAKRLERRLRRAGWDAIVHTAETWNDFIKAVVDALRSRPYAVVVFGGDGSVRYAASRVARAKGLLGIVPCGRFNNIFRSLYGNTDTEAALDIIRSEHQIRIDAGLANGKFFLGSLITGLIPMLLKRLGDKKLPRLTLSWSKLAARAIDDTMPRTTVLKIDTFTFKVQPLILNVQLLPYFMSLRFAPAAVPDDGRVILIYDREGTRESVMHFVRDLRKDRHQYTDGVQMVRAKRVSISNPGGQEWFMDGDLVEFTGEEITIEVLNRILRIFSNAPEKK
jgi:diacylglycerol kinase (ATP)